MSLLFLSRSFFLKVCLITANVGIKHFSKKGKQKEFNAYFWGII